MEPSSSVPPRRSGGLDFLYRVVATRASSVEQKSDRETDDDTVSAINERRTRNNIIRVSSNTYGRIVRMFRPIGIQWSRRISFDRIRRCGNEERIRRIVKTNSYDVERGRKRGERYEQRYAYGTSSSSLQITLLRSGVLDRRFSNGARFSSSATTPTTAIDENTFHHVADDTLARISEAAEELEDAVGSSFDVVETDGVLTVHMGDLGTYVINKQTPNRQLWWSSPISGPKRYAYDPESKRWLNTRDAHKLSDILRQEILQSTGIELPDVDGDAV